MNEKSSGCPGCSCQIVDQSVKREGRHLTFIETVFTCGARKREITDTASNIGRVELEECCCAC